MIKHFISTLAAILVAAAIIFGIKSHNDENRRLAEMRQETERINRQTDAMMREARLYSDSSPTPSPTPTPTAEISEATLTKPVDVQLKYGNAKLPSGMKLKIVSRNGSTLFVDYVGEKIEVPIDATDVR